MNWEVAGAVGEIFGATAVVLTLLYLSRQLSQQATSTKSESLSSWLADYNASVIELFKDRDAADVFRRGLADFEKMDEIDQMRFHSWMVPHLMNAQTVFMQAQDDAQHRQLSEFILNFNGSMLSTKGGLEWWSHTRKVAEPVFADEMDKRIAASSPVSDSMPWFVDQSFADEQL